MPLKVITRINHLGMAQDMPNDLIFGDCHGHALPPDLHDNADVNNADTITSSNTTISQPPPPPLPVHLPVPLYQPPAAAGVDHHAPAIQHQDMVNVEGARVLPQMPAEPVPIAGVPAKVEPIAGVPAAGVPAVLLAGVPAAGVPAVPVVNVKCHCQSQSDGRSGQCCSPSHPRSSPCSSTWSGQHHLNRASWRSAP